MQSNFMKDIKKQLTLARLNDGLSLVVVSLALYILIFPLLPAASWWVKYEAPIVSVQRQSNVIPVQPEDIPAENTLSIPALGLREAILEGQSVATVDKGVWRRPNTSTPDRASNTVLVGHRFTYRGAAVFYNLDKIKIGDELALYWEGKAYTYKVFAINVVTPEADIVEQPTSEPILTLYTCTPLWSSKQRLVIQAQLIEEAR